MMEIWLQVVFQYKGVKKIRLGQSHWTHDDDEEEWDPSRGPSDTEHWNESMYTRVFLQPYSAQLWESWNR